MILEDTTLRDGEQAPGLAFGKEAKLEIYKALVCAGVRWIEVGIPAIRGGGELESVKLLNSLAKEDRVTAVAWNRGLGRRSSSL